MKKVIFAAVMILILVMGCTPKQDPKINEIQQNKETSAQYHALKAGDIDSILTDNFMGRSAKDLHTWNRERPPWIPFQ